jgi:hypothetical protein
MTDLQRPRTTKRAHDPEHLGPVLSERVQAALDLLQTLLADGVELDARTIHEHAFALDISSGHLRVARLRLRIKPRPRFRIKENGRKGAIETWVWKLPRVAPPPPAPELPAAPPSPPSNMRPEARAQLIWVNRRRTHPDGDAEYARLCAGGAPLPTPSQEPWLKRRRRR